MTHLAPAPGRYLLDEGRPSLGMSACYVVVEPSPCGSPVVFVGTFTSCGRKPVRRFVRVAVDGSWRDGSSYLPVNCYGETFL